MSPHKIMATASSCDYSSAAPSLGGPVLAPPSATATYTASTAPTASTAGSNGAVARGHSLRSAFLTATDPDAVQDLICVGFGPASLGIAVALHDALEAGTLAAPPPRVLFLEKQARFAWHAGMLLPGARMQISFIKDLASLRDPRSHFTFLNYLHRHGRLVEFTNLSTFLPARLEYEDYLRWAARHFDHVVRYGCEVEAVSPVVASAAAATPGPTIAAAGGKQQQQPPPAVDMFAVRSRDAATGITSTFRARNVIIAVGGQPSMPRSLLQARSPRVIHSSQFEHRVRAVLPDPAAPYRVAVVGAGQSAAEIFNSVQEMYPNSRTTLIMRSEFLKPSDDSPFVNSIFNPSFIDSVYPRPAAARRHLLTDARATNYSVVRLELIEHLYEKMYHQRREFGPDEAAWPHRILAGRGIVSVEEVPSAGGGQLRARIRPVEEALSEDGELVEVERREFEEAVPETLDVDLIVAATGYRRGAHVDLLRDAWELLPAAGKQHKEQQQQQQQQHHNGVNGVGKNGLGARGESSPAASGDRWIVKTTTTTTTTTTNTTTNSTTRVMEVRRDYGLRFAPGAVAAGAGVWLQGCCEGTHGLSDTLLSVVGTRSGDIVQSIFGKESA